MVDLHCHILPNIDDGAKNSKESIAILKMQEEQGFKRIVATPHYYVQKESIDSFLKRRANALNELCNDSAILDIDLFFKLGAEVFFSDELINMPLEKLCFEKTKYLLLELPTDYKPLNLEQFLYEIQLKGITPIIAHIERYRYAMQDLDLVYDWVENGALIQINATGLIRSKSIERILLKLINCNLVHVIATDTHNTEKRKPQMDLAIKVLKKKISISKMNELKQNTIDIFDGKEIDTSNILRPKKSIFSFK